MTTITHELTIDDRSQGSSQPGSPGMALFRTVRAYTPEDAEAGRRRLAIGEKARLHDFMLFFMVPLWLNRRTVTNLGGGRFELVRHRLFRRPVVTIEHI